MQETKHDTLCWGCEKACGRCSWSKNFVPVPGWKAIPTKIFQYTRGQGGNHYRYHTDSFDVYECPEFEPLKAMNTKRFLDEVNFVKAKKENQSEAKKRHRKKLEAAIVKMLEVGMTYSMIEKETGISRGSIYRIKKKGETENAEN